VSEAAADKRLLVIQTEFGSVLQVMTRSGNTLSPVLRDAWDGGDLRVMTKTRPAAASGEHIAIIAHTTAEELLQRIETTDLWNGFANRFLWCATSRAQLLPHGGNLDNSILQPLRAEMGKILRWTARLKGKAITWEKPVAKEWAKVYSSLARSTPGLIGAVTSRGEAQVVRLALIYALLDGSDAIRSEHLRAAFAAWKFCESSARQVFASSTGDSTADRIRMALRQSDRGLTRTEISSLFGRHRGGDEISRALDLLKQMEIGECHREKGSGRSTERWFLKGK
jgi:hypothetical protein